MKLMNSRILKFVFLALALSSLNVGCAGTSATVQEEEPAPGDGIQKTALSVNLQAEKVEFQRRVEANPSDWDSWNALGTVLYRLNEIDAAEKALLKAYEISPKEPAILSSLGLLRHRQGKHKEARALLEEAINLRPGHGPAHNNLGLVFVALNQKSAARSSFESALAANPNDLVALENLGLFLHYHDADAAGAKRYLEHRIREMQRRHLEISAEDYRDVALASLFSDDADSAITYLEEATKIAPNRNELFFHLGMAYVQVREFETARRLLQKVHQKEIDTPLYAGMLGRLLVRMRRCDEALPVLQKSVEQDPEDAEVYMAIGVCRERMGQKKQSTTAYSRSCALGLRDACGPGEKPPAVGGNKK